MKQLINYCPVHGYKEEIAAYPGGMNGYLKDSNLDGVELYVYDTKPYEEDYSKWATGVHLKYWPYWLDFWYNNQEELARNHKNKQDTPLPYRHEHGICYEQSLYHFVHTASQQACE